MAPSYKLQLEGPGLAQFGENLQEALAPSARVVTQRKYADVLVYMDFRERLTSLEDWLRSTDPFKATKERVVCLNYLSHRSRFQLKKHKIRYVQLMDNSVRTVASRILGELHIIHNRPAQVPYIIGNSHAMAEIFEQVERIADHDESVLIQGESGTGKELLSRYLHESRGQGELVAYNCGTLHSGNIQEVLQGKGDAQGIFQLAGEGTCLLDEIGNLDEKSQVSLLRLIEDPTRTCRLVFATNLDLKTAMEEGRFRPDLYHRMATFHIQLPSLLERSEDLPLLVNHIIENHNQQNETSIKAPLSYNSFYSYHWPGNVRQLQAVLKGALVAMPEAFGPLDELLIKEAIDRAQNQIKGPEQNDIPFYRGEDSWDNLHDRALRLYLEDAINRFEGITQETVDLIGYRKSWIYKQAKKLDLSLK